YHVLSPNKMPVKSLLECVKCKEIELVSDKSLNDFIGLDNPVAPNISPDPTEAKEADETLRKTIRLANLLDVPVVNTFSGIAGSDDTAKKPNLPVTPWPTAYSEIYDYQWNEKLIPYWQDLAVFAKEQDVKIAIELHAGFLVHTPYT
ncbi:sugar phosphate isomerase/epimerase family protein, partial [Staphylococcus aureus]|uniref:sugar phosphate isomerase/epimerase family protein n=1 Tax=Staphylococcus aureus TaxID=1280 RepID=UPI00210A14D5